MIKVLTIGKKHNPLLRGAIEDYEKRIKSIVKYEMKILTHSPVGGIQARDDESMSLLKLLDERDFVILFDEHGGSFTSEKLAATIETANIQSRNIVFVIGGAYGVSDAMKSRADSILAFGSSVFPHQLIRLMAVEQIYRSLTIINGLPYHNA